MLGVDFQRPLWNNPLPTIPERGAAGARAVAEGQSRTLSGVVVGHSVPPRGILPSTEAENADTTSLGSLVREPGSP
jgi:hypothetical protein